MDWIDITGKWNKLEFFISNENRFPSLSGAPEEKTLAEFLKFIEEQKNKQIKDFPDDSNGTISFFLLKGFNDKLDELETTFSENPGFSNEKSKDSIQKSSITNSTSVEEEGSETESLKNQSSNKESEKMDAEQMFSQMEESSLSAFSPELNFIEDENGDYRLTQSQIEILQRISLIQEYIKTHDYIDSQDEKILELDILTQKNLFEQKIDVYRDDNLCKFWDDCIFFNRKWKDPKNPNARADYYMNFDIKLNPDDTLESTPGFMMFGFDVKDDFVPNLSLEDNKELFNKVCSFSNYRQRDVIFFVNSQYIYVMRYGSWSELLIVQKDDVFEDYMCFLDFSCELSEDTYSYASKELGRFYKELKEKIED